MMDTYKFRDLPVFHFNDSALDQMGAYDNVRVAKFQSRGWVYHQVIEWSAEDGWQESGFLFKDLKDGRMVKITDRRTFLKTRKWFEVLVYDQYGRETHTQYFTF